MRDLFTMMRTRFRGRHRVFEWMKGEFESYADPKHEGYREGGKEYIGNVWMRETGMQPDGEWVRQITQYFDRANAYGLDTLQGRQAVMKSITTLVDCAASMIRVYGQPPPPGYPSGECIQPGQPGRSNERQ
jgi:hypothetical protein